MSQPTHHRSKCSLSRRQFLRGSSVLLGLPAFTSLASAADSKAPPVRTAFIYFPNGVWEKDWTPEGAGTEFQLSKSLAPLESVRNHINVLSGLDKQHSHEGDGHYAKTANFLTGLPVVKTTGKNINSGGISVDQLIAQQIGDRTPLPSLELGTEPVISGIDSNVGYTRLYGSHISWQSATRPIAKEINPRIVYERLFGQTVLGRTQAESYRNLLDYVLEDAKRIRQQLGRDDQFKMDEYLDSVRSVERRIEFSTKRSAQESARRVAAPEAPEAGIPEDFRDHIDLMLDLLVLAFQTDSTRVSTFMFANDVSGRSFSFLDGVSGGHHQLSHHENKEEKIAQYQLINRWHVEKFARMLEKMRAIQEGEGTLLDNCMIMFGSSFSDGNRHDPDNLPILLAGNAGGSIKSGRHLETNVPLCNLYLTMLDRLGIQAERFGDSTGQIEL